MLRLDVLPQLHQEAPAADKHVQRVVWLHLVDLVGSNITFAEGRHPKVNEGRCERGTAQAAKPMGRTRQVHRRPVLTDPRHWRRLTRGQIHNNCNVRVLLSPRLWQRGQASISTVHDSINKKSIEGLLTTTQSHQDYRLSIPLHFAWRAALGERRNYPLRLQ